MLRNVRSGLQSLFRNEQVDRELDEEVRAYLEMVVEEKMKQGMSREEAFRAVRLEHGSLDVTKEIVRSAGWESFVETCWQDVRFGFRTLRKNPGFSCISLLILALGISANTVIFSLVNGFLLRKPPVRDPDQLMVVSGKWAGNGGEWDRLPVSGPDFLDWRTQAGAFSGIVAASFDDYTITGSAIPERVSGGRVSADFFQTLGVASTLGRTILSGEDQPGHDRVVVLSDGLWKENFGADPNIIGRIIRINGNPYTIVGVMPSNFHLWDFEARMWIPLAFSHQEIGPSGRKTRFLRVFARLKSGITAKQASAEMESIAQRIAQAHPDTNRGWATSVKSIQQYSIEDANVTTGLLFLTISVGFVMLIACGNLANLLLARSLARRREFAVRAALGAGRVRLTRQLLSECFILSLAGGGLGLPMAFGAMQVLRTQMNWSEGMASLASTVTIDMHVLLFVLAISAASAFIFGLLPALQASRADLNIELKEGSRSSSISRERRRFQQLLVIGQVALSLVLLTGAYLFVEGFLHEIQASPGFNAHNVLTASVSLRGFEYYGAPQREAAFFTSALQNLSNYAEVESAALTSDFPFSFPNEKNFEVEGQSVARPEDRPRCGALLVSPGYFRTLQIPVLQGREFSLTDNANSNAAVIVDRAFVMRYFPNENPIGRHIKPVEESETQNKWLEIVGVVGDVNEFLGQQDSRPHFFEPFLAYPTGSMNFVVRTRSAPAGFSDMMRRAIWAVDRNQAIASVRTMQDVIADSGQGDNIMAELMGTFAAIALALATIGIYGVISYAAEQRSHEMGIRLSLGAKPTQVLMLVIRSGMSLAGIGVALGLLMSLAVPKLVSATFNGFRASNVGALLTGAVVVVAASFLACYIPARRALRVDPIVSLRYE